MLFKIICLISLFLFTIDTPINVELVDDDNENNKTSKKYHVGIPLFGKIATKNVAANEIVNLTIYPINHL